MKVQRHAVKAKGYGQYLAGPSGGQALDHPAQPVGISPVASARPALTRLA